MSRSSSTESLYNDTDLSPEERFDNDERPEFAEPGKDGIPEEPADELEALETAGSEVCGLDGAGPGEWAEFALSLRSAGWELRRMGQPR